MNRPALNLTTEQLFNANRAAIDNAETPEQIVARLRVQRRTEMSIRPRGAAAQVRAAGGSLADEIVAMTKAMTEVKREYDAMIAKHLPPVKWSGGTQEYDPLFDNTIASHRYFGRL